ncbi:hypothetical protein GGS23DRAFT_563455 [Durotheca rogersii]|uniref:uncharacterized protein n=1 Tax=Durotheca rogersii TaxID=419775 RepID=UPI00221E4F97|nr:uncharacterized protein GGS23DRAFT_563455 [Durotheca rogersii]KAI5864234.1 hypothetical protein GGS23DRAFT_563455 [Durotheca rogersii]
MTEGLQATEDAAAARAAEQARLRKERREAKIKAGGAARLNKITGLGGGVQRDPPPQPPLDSSVPQATATTSSSPAAMATPPPPAGQHGDPEEVDISEHHYVPRTTDRSLASNLSSDDISEARLRNMMLGLDRPSLAGTPPPAGRDPFLSGGTPPSIPGMEGMDNDPVVKMVSQLMSRAGGGPNTGSDNTVRQTEQAAVDKPLDLWRILHAVFAFGLGLYVVLSTTFTGTLTEREHSALSAKEGAEVDSIERSRVYFFYVFSAVEALLLTARFFLEDKGQNAQPKSLVWAMSGFIPQPARGYVQHALRYGQILSTVRIDALMCVFVLGVCSWWRS